MGKSTKRGWQNRVPNIEDSLKYVYQRSKYCDVNIQVTDIKDGSSMCFSAHKLVLATRSSVFADVFFSRKQSNKILQVKCSPRAFDVLLWYIYTDTIETEDVDELIESFEVATTYKIFSFWNICAEKLLEQSSNINRRNACSVLEIANTAKSVTLHNICFQIIQKELENIFVSNDFLILNENTVWDLLKSSKLNICAKQMLKNLIKWMKYKNVTDRKFLSFIDFSGFCTEDFLDIVEEFPYFFSGHEIRAFLSKLTHKQSTDLPTWLSLPETKTIEKCPLNYSLYEGKELIRNCATRVQTDCNQSFSKITMYSSTGFEQETFLKFIMKCRTLKLVMIELAFGSEFVPLDCLMIELFSNANPEKKMKSLKFHLIPSLQHYYLLFDDDVISLLSSNFNLLVVVKAFGLLDWGLQGPVSDQKWRVASVSECSEIKTLNVGFVQIVRLKTFLDWLLFINPTNGEKKFLISSLYFDTGENASKYLQRLKLGKVEE